ncbi:hypothetical protein [Blastococcus goldschmidtiae]|uniref:Uncharacterized protein n=1 Tax=Blastococcus goldschmidtiae TaxID=3075546 RepID=A0ABU2KCT0_9ACTN|nr:hypothetical protein [Blastococcus sp. DSM 46792]MDT0278002.1 hypothetical protein [Blastococcus sp. DSM 46792]
MVDPNAQDPLGGLGPDPLDAWVAVASRIGQVADVAGGDAREHGDPLDADAGGAQRADALAHRGSVYERPPSAEGLRAMHGTARRGSGSSALGASAAISHIGDARSVHVPGTRMSAVPPHPTLGALDTATCPLDGPAVLGTGMACVVDVGEGVAGVRAAVAAGRARPAGDHASPNGNTATG